MKLLENASFNMGLTGLLLLQLRLNLLDITKKQWERITLAVIEWQFLLNHQNYLFKNTLKHKIMGHIKKPKGLDFVIQSEPLIDKDRKEISKFIADYKEKRIKKSRTRNKKETI